MSMIRMSAPGLATLQRGFEQAPQYTQERLEAGMVEATMLLEREVEDAMPAVSGLTRASVYSDTFSTPAGVLGIVASNSVAAAAVELGTRPHMPPVAPIEMWVQEKLGKSAAEARGVAFAIARKIARYGTQGQHPFEKTLRQQMGALTRIFEGVAQDVATHLASLGGGGWA